MRSKPNPSRAGLLVAIVALGIALVTLACDTEPEVIGADPTPAGAPPALPGIGDRVRLGSLELTVLAIEQYDASRHNPYNDANARVLVRVRKHKGEEYRFSLFSAFTLIDESGVGHDAYWACAGCPNDLFAGGGLALYGDAAVERYVYFVVPMGATPVALRYKPGLSLTTSAVVIEMR